MVIARIKHPSLKYTTRTALLFHPHSPHMDSYLIMLMHNIQILEYDCLHEEMIFLNVIVFGQGNGRHSEDKNMGKK